MTPKSPLSGSPSNSQVSRPMNRPRSRLPEGYSPGNSLPPGYIPPARDLLADGDRFREQNKRTSLTNRQIMLLAGGIVALVALVIVVVFAVAGSLFVGNAINGNGDTTLQRFYSDLESQNYTHAYSLLSPQTQAGQKQDEFVNHFKQLDALNGNIAKFNIVSDTVSGNKATAIVQFTRDPSQPRISVDTIQLVQSNGTWLIDRISSRNIDPTPAT